MAYKFRFAQPCTACQKGTHEACDTCHKPYCGHGACLFQTGTMITSPPDPRDEEPEEWSRPEELCLECFTTREGHAPFSIWAETARHSTFAFSLLQKGSIAPAGDAHSWYSPPAAGKMLQLRYGNTVIEYTTFDVVQLLNFLQAHEEEIREQAKETSEVLIAESHKRTEAAMRADAGIVDHSQYE